MNILLIDDDASLRKTTRIGLEAMEHRVTEARNATEALELLGHRAFQVALLDLQLGADAGLDLLPQLLALAPGLQVVIITAYATIETAVEAMRRGACDYLPKPFTPGQLRLVLERTARVRHLESTVDELEAQLRASVPEVDLQTQESAMRSVLDLAFKAAVSDAAVLIRGESGTGKGVLARAIHSRSRRGHAPYVTVNCPSLSGELLESELFGHVQGAFTGASRDTTGKVAAAETGTLFLDEIGDLPISLQPKLLRLLQEKQYERVGETRTRACDVRVIAATNRPLEQEIATGRFREDLFYRLNVIELHLPPLRERSHDILPMAERLTRFFAAQAGKAIGGLTNEAREALQHHSWPGNIRELRNGIERAVILSTQSVLGLADLPASISTPKAVGVEVGARVSLAELEQEHVRRVLGSTATIEEAAEILGIDPSTLWRKRKRYGL
ncbi:MAG TPA: sigma-54 dependent transcriptional regulator [Pirellulales bacterium]|nr:sigma-54 dependent transcriptional regulator [Pirellulales bacterium]